MIVEQTTAARDVLARSPSFAMSLGAKELFHTNFLAFLLESDDEELDDVRRALREALRFPVLPGERSCCFVWREKKHLDLVVVPVAENPNEVLTDEPVRNRALVVEAKLKSIPSRRQLTDYQTKTLTSLSLSHDEWQARRRITLRMDQTRASIKPDLLLLAPTNDTVHDDWLTASWSAVQSRLQNAAEKLSVGSTYRTVLVDYANALSALLEIVHATRQLVGYAQCSPDMTYGAYVEELTHGELRRFRLHDLVGKLANDEWARRLMGSLETMVGVEQCSCVTPYVHFSNSQPGLGLEVNAPNGFQIGIQVQGHQFRRYVSCANERGDLEQRMTQPNLWNGWFMQSVADRNLTGRAEQAAGAITNLRCFNRNKFLYSALDLQPFNWKDAESAILGSATLALQLASDGTIWE